MCGRQPGGKAWRLKIVSEFATMRVHAVRSPCANPVRAKISVCKRWLLPCAVEGIDELAKFTLKQELLEGVITAGVGESLPLDHVVATIER